MVEADQTLVENEAARTWAADNRADPGEFAAQSKATREVYRLYIQQKLGHPLHGTPS